MLINQTRKDQTRLELERLHAEVSIWLTKRRKKDVRQQHRTQLRAIETLLDAAIGYLQRSLGEIDVRQVREEVYEACRLFDWRVLWLRRVWDYYKDKFDQRDDDEKLGPLLRAADEVVWSCYRQVFVNAKALAIDVKQGPAPLPFVEFAYSPESLPSELVPYELKPDEAGFLRDIFGRLPVPLVSLPQSCVTSPWWLIYVGHEVGHHIQFDLAPRAEMVTRFQGAIVKAVEGKDGGFADDAQKWGYWGKEIFADVFSVLAMGPWAAWAMVEFESKRPADMAQRRSQYPPPAVRLSFLAETVNRLGLDGAATLRGLDPEALVKEDEVASRDLNHAKSVAALAINNSLPGMAVRLKDLVDFQPGDFKSGQTVDVFKRALLGLEPLSSSNTLPAARQVASASVAAWAALLTKWTEEENDERISADERSARHLRRAFEREELAKRTLDFIEKCFEPTERAGEDSGDRSALGIDLAEKLLAVGERELMS